MQRLPTTPWGQQVFKAGIRSASPRLQLSHRAGLCNSTFMAHVKSTARKMLGCTSCLKAFQSRQSWWIQLQKYCHLWPRGWRSKIRHQ